MAETRDKQLTLAVLMWGFGGTSYGPHRTRKIFVADPDGARLEAALAPLRTPISTATSCAQSTC